MDQFIRSKDNSDIQKSIKLSQAEASGEITETTLNNGTTVRGQVTPDGLQGKCELTFAEGSLLEGEFSSAVLQKAAIRYSPGVSVQAVFHSEKLTLEIFMVKFLAVLPSGYRVEASVSNEGVLKHAVVIDSQGQVVAQSAGPQLEIDLSQKDGNKLLVTKRWVYEGKVTEVGGNLSQQRSICGPGIQLWYTGIGYHRIDSVGQFTRKSILRFNRNLELYRETLYLDDQLQKSLTFYGNGLFFFTHQDFFNGHLIFMLSNNSLRLFRCTMEEYWFLKEGTLFLDADETKPRKIQFKRKDRRLFFYVENCEYDLASFKEILASSSFSN